MEAGVLRQENDSQSLVKTITKDLEDALVNLGMLFDILPFGCFVNGLASPGSDLLFLLSTLLNL